MVVATGPTAGGHVPTRRQIITAGTIAIAGLAARAPAFADSSGVSRTSEISHTAQAIHQERLFKATRRRVYEALVLSEQFDKVIRLSGTIPAEDLQKAPTAIGTTAGGSFSLFGGQIVGRQIELVPDELIVQAWRAGDWERGIYSLVRFELIDQGAATRLVFDHGAFPKGQGKELAAGWQEHYWAPLEKFLS
jgi:activator of HSP90 ATPase